MPKRWHGLMLLLLLLMTTQFASQLSTADSGSDWNSLLYPQDPQNVWVYVSQSIQGTSNVTAPGTGCPAGVYNWTYQANVQQGSELDHSWIQQVIEVSQSGYSCYSIEFWPNLRLEPAVVDAAAVNITTSSILYDASSTISFWMSYTGGPTYAVTAFYASACCTSSGATITWKIYPDQLQSSPIQFDTSSKEDFNIVGAASLPCFLGNPHCTGSGRATFTSGDGTINYCSYNNAGLVSAQSGETSNMVYGDLSQLICNGGNEKWFYQSFAPGTLGGPNISVQTVDQNDNSITGYYVGLYNYGGTLINSGFSPVSFSDLTQGSSYYVKPDNYGSCTFNYWQDTGNATADRYVIAYGTQSLTAVYNCSSSSTGSVTVNTVNQNNQAITGYYVGLYSSGGTLLNHGFSPVTFSGLTVGTTYSVEPDNYGSCVFNHWQDTGSTLRDRSFTAASTQTFTAVYDCT